MSDWSIMIMLFLLGGVTEFIISKYLGNGKNRIYISILIWLGLAIIFIVLWLVRG